MPRAVPLHAKCAEDAASRGDGGRRSADHRARPESAYHPRWLDQIRGLALPLDAMTPQALQALATRIHEERDALGG